MSNIKLFDGKEIRTHWDEEKQEWYFSVVDVVGVLSGSSQPRKYWNDLKKKLDTMGSELSENIGQLKMQSSDGKFYKTDVLGTKGMLRLVQSIPSPNAEPFKMWLAEVGDDRLNETADPELAIDRALKTYLKKGYSREWINQRLMSIEVRKELTDEWEDSGISTDKEYAILTDEITKAWSGKTVNQYKSHKGLKKESLRDNMTNLEIVLNMLAEATTTEISKKEQPSGFNESLKVAREGGSVAGNARKDIGNMHLRKFLLLNLFVLILQLMSGVISIVSLEKSLFFTVLSFCSAFSTIGVGCLYLLRNKHYKNTLLKATYLLLFYLSVIIPTFLVGLLWVVVETDLLWLAFISYYISLMLYFALFLWRDYFKYTFIKEIKEQD